MRKIDDGGPAFPQLDVVAGERDGHGDVIDAYTTTTGGMSLRDWFAGQALMAALTLSPPVLPEQIASVAYAIADAMMSARTEP